MTEATINTKVCTRCGRELPETDFYQVKYKGEEPKYRYSVCKTCTTIEQRRRYLLKTDPDNPTLAKIEELYEKHRAAGRSVPGNSTARRSNSQIEAEIDNLLNMEG